MQKPQPFVLEYWLIIGILLAVWFAVGRSIFMPLGWAVFLSVPIGINLLRYVFLIERSIKEFQPQLQGQQYEKLAFWIKFFWIGLFTTGLTFLDGGDSSDSTGSALTFILGLDNNRAVDIISGVFAWIVILSTVVAMIKISFFFKRMRARQKLGNHIAN